MILAFYFTVNARMLVKNTRTTSIGLVTLPWSGRHQQFYLQLILCHLTDPQRSTYLKNWRASWSGFLNSYYVPRQDLNQALSDTELYNLLTRLYCFNASWHYMSANTFYQFIYSHNPILQFQNWTKGKTTVQVPKDTSHIWLQSTDI